MDLFQFIFQYLPFHPEAVDGACLSHQEIQLKQRSTSHLATSHGCPLKWSPFFCFPFLTFSSVSRRNHQNIWKNHPFAPFPEWMTFSAKKASTHPKAKLPHCCGKKIQIPNKTTWNSPKPSETPQTSCFWALFFGSQWDTLSPQNLEKKTGRYIPPL